MMEMENRQYEKFERAQRRVSKIRSFYKHVVVFAIINGILLLSKNMMLHAFLGEEAVNYPEAMNWIYWNIYIWLVIIAIHGLSVFGRIPDFIRKWEKSQIQKYIERDEKESKKYQ